MAPRIRSRDQRHHPVSRGLGQRTAINFGPVVRSRGLSRASRFRGRDLLRGSRAVLPSPTASKRMCHLRSNFDSIVSLKSLLNPMKRISSRVSHSTATTVFHFFLPSFLLTFRRRNFCENESLDLSVKK